MEEAALGISHFLVRLIIPIGVLAVCVGLVTLVVMTFPPKNMRVGGSVFFGGPLRTPAPIVERIAVGLSTPIPILGLIAIVQSVRLRNPGEPVLWLPLALAVAAILVGLPAVLWKTRLRFAAEGLATIGLAAASVLTGFSIGFLFVPLTLLMMWTCLQNLREVAMPSKREVATPSKLR
jgi:hypothetical protein